VYSYFNRDVSWLSFNYRVLLESEDANLPIYERIRFLAIHASNLEEFYKIRVAEYRSIIMKKVHSEEDPKEAESILEEIKTEVTRQQQEFFRIFSTEILPELQKKNIILYMDNRLESEHLEFIRNYFQEEIYPFLQPVMLFKDDIRIFIRDNRLYQVVHLKKKDNGEVHYAIIKIPFAKVPRFIELPKIKGNYYYMFVEDIISANLDEIFIAYDILGSYNIKISRDADIYIDENKQNDIVESIRKKVKKRKIGDLSRFVYDRRMPEECLRYVCETFHIGEEDLIPDNVHLSMENLSKLPNPKGKDLEVASFQSLKISELERANWIFPLIRKKDIFLHYPYHTFNYFIRFLMEASLNPNVEEIMITQYRVAQDSEIITNLISAAKNGKKVTVFVELKARFDEENNLYTAEVMKNAGIKIIYSIPGLKVHAKVALVKEKTKSGKFRSYAYLSTGNFNEKTAEIYSDMGILTSNRKLTREIVQLFEVLSSRKRDVEFKNLLVAQFNMIPVLRRMIEREIRHAKQGKKAQIILKMNGLQDATMINELYKASESGVEIDLIVRGICSIIPNQPYSKNVRITRIVDTFLEHSRIWYFYNDGKNDLFLTSSDWMKRNLYRRIETAFPIIDKTIKQTIRRILDIQLRDNVKACFIDDKLKNIFKRDIEKREQPRFHAQKDIYDLLKNKDL
jgi:polyphosphate kinase 1